MSNILRFFILTCFLFSFSAVAYSQEGIIRGHVYDQSTGEPIIYANIYIDGTTLGTNTDELGFFTITDIPVGPQKIVVTYLGYEDLGLDIEVKNSKVKYYKLDMISGGVQLGVIDISAERQQARTEVRISKIKVSKKQIKALPSTGGDADIVQYLQVLPGIISTGDQGGQLYIRGGSPVQNKILLDGLTIYNPFHSIGFFSSFETEIIRNVDVLTGAYNAEHGGRISAIVDITTREGNRKKLSGQLSASPFMVKTVLEGPLTRKADTGGGLSFVLAGKRGIIDESSKVLYNYAAPNDTIGLPFGFQDLYGKLSYITANGSRFNFFGFNFDDQFKNPLLSRIDWNNRGGGLNFNLLPTGSSLTLNGIVGFSQYEVGINEADNRPRNSLIREYNLGLDFNYLTNASSIIYGVDIKSIKTVFDFSNPFGYQYSLNENTTQIAGFLKYRRAWDNLVIEPGFRVQYYAAISEFYPEPRLGLKWNITDNTRFKAGAGLYSQNIFSTSNERDVVNLFNGFITVPGSEIIGLDNRPIESKLQTARHVLAGIEHDISNNLQINVEGYLKDFNQLIVVNRNKVNQSDPDYGTEEGQAYGVDFSAKYETSDLYLWGTYSYSFVNRFDGEQEYPTIFDRRHNVNLLATYSMGERNDLLFSVRWNFGSGFPFTQTQGFYNNVNFLDGISTPVETDNSEVIGIIYADDRNGGRLPYYHRLDISVTKTFHFGNSRNMEVVGAVTNVYDRSNIFYFDRVLFERVNQLPIMPSLAARFNF